MAESGRGLYLGVDDALDDDYDEDGGCTWCGGDGWDECDDPIQCLDPKCDGEIHPCTACAGTGLIEHQVIW